MPNELAMVQVREINDKDYRVRATIRDDTFDDLVASIGRSGVLVPILLLRTDMGFSLVAGHRRFAAACEIGLQEIPAYITDGDRDDAWSGSFAENLFRRDLSPIELAAAIKDCVASGGYTIETIAKSLGRSDQWIRLYLDIADWPADLSVAVHAGRLSVAAARNLAEIDDDGHRQMLVDYAIENGATARITAAWLQAWQAGKPTREPATTEPVAGGSSLPPLEPYTPCVVCGGQQKMINLRYLPVCTGCQDIVVDLARQLAQGEGAAKV